MRYRDSRHRCSYVLRFSIGRETVMGEALNISRSGMIARLPGRYQRGQPVVFTLNRQERSAMIVRTAGPQLTALRFDRPLTQSEFDEITSVPSRRNRGHVRTLSELR